jgi:hypothetical protein
MHARVGGRQLDGGSDTEHTGHDGRGGRGWSRGTAAAGRIRELGNRRETTTPGQGQARNSMPEPSRVTLPTMSGRMTLELRLRARTTRAAAVRA